MSSFSGLFLCILYLKSIHGTTYQHHMSIFFSETGEGDYCTLKCGNQNKHTLCTTGISLPAKACGENFLLYKIEGKLRDHIMFGHNGLRSRISERMSVANMVKLHWDDELAKMAEKWLQQCRPYEKDPCTSLTDKTVNGKPIYYNIAQSRYINPFKFFPPNFIASVMRTWYLEKNYMTPPTVKKDKLGAIGVLKSKHNNFTQLASPNVQQIGCSLGRNEQGYHMVCNYFPYLQKDFIFKYGEPASECPNLFPLQDYLFEDLCSADKASFLKSQIVMILLAFLLS